MKKKIPRVGRCVWCGHWGLLWGRFCRHPYKNKAAMCRVYHGRWVRSKNEVAPPLKDDGSWMQLRNCWPWEMAGSSGRMRKVFRVQGWCD